MIKYLKFKTLRYFIPIIGLLLIVFKKEVLYEDLPYNLFTVLSIAAINGPLIGNFAFKIITHTA